MKGIKGFSILGIVLLIVGIIGVLLTYGSEKETISEEKEFQDENFNAIDINTDNAKVEIIATNDTTSKMELTGSRPKNSKIKYTVNVTDGKLLIELKERQGKLFNFDFLSTSLTLKVYVPEKEYESLEVTNDDGKIDMNHLNVKEIHATISNGRLKMEDIKGSKLTVGADDGSIHADNMQVDDVKMKLSNGKIALSQVETARIKTETDDGKIVLDDVGGEIVGKTSNGSISLMTDDLERPIAFKADDGSIKIKTRKKPENVEFDVNIDDGIVNILNDFKGSTVIGNGDNLIKLTISNGKISVLEES